MDRTDSTPSPPEVREADDAPKWPQTQLRPPGAGLGFLLVGGWSVCIYIYIYGSPAGTYLLGEHTVFYSVLC